ncbi:RNA-directed DNA polymerase, eukaryota, reverse transcriptase zinc-binding domain protein [Tanacetum coccineum]
MHGRRKAVVWSQNVLTYVHREAVSIFDNGLRRAIEAIVVCEGPFFGDFQWRLASLPIWTTTFFRDVVLMGLILTMDMRWTEIVKSLGVSFDLFLRQKAMVECLRAPRAQNFLTVIPIEGLGQHMSALEYRTILKYRLMILLFPVDKPCLVCRKVCLDSFEGRDPRELSDISTSKGGQVALKAESSKVANTRKACLEIQHVFIPFAFDTFDSFVYDHRPIILKHALVDFRPVPFKFYYSWLNEPSLDAVIKSVWHEHDSLVGAGSIFSFEDKLKNLMLAIKSWAKSLSEAKCKDKDALMSSIKDLETFSKMTHFPTLVTVYRPISLIGAQYKIIAKILSSRLARVIDSIISYEQTAFIKNRQILDGPLMVNEIVDWFKRKKKSLMIFKIDFEKAFDSVSWDFLFQVMVFMGFSPKWISWISGCLSSAKASVLINGSPTTEFHLGRGLRQGDPLSPFLFIMIMEGLHVAVEDAILAGCFQGVTVGSLNISHLLFADDVVFLGEWSRSNIINVVNLLQCFYRVSGLKVNLYKSNLYGVGISYDEIQRLALLTGCNSKRLPFVYLGLLIAENMAKKRMGTYSQQYFSLFPLPKCVIKTLESIRAQFFWGNDGNSYKIPWIDWNSTLASKAKGGLGIGSLKSLNHALIQKWRWRFLKMPTALWVMTIKAIHGSSQDSFIFNCSVKGNGVWSRIVKDINAMNDQGLISH